MTAIRANRPTLATAVLASLALLATVASPATPGTPGRDQPRADYQTGVRWFFMTADREVPAHRLAKHLARYAANKLNGDVAVEGKHVANSFPAGAWLATNAPSARVHTLVRQRAASLGNIPATANQSADAFPLNAAARILGLDKQGSVVNCRVRLTLSGAGGHTLETTRFTGRGGPEGIHVFAARIPDRLVRQRLPEHTTHPAATYLLITVNVGRPGAEKAPALPGTRARAPSPAAVQQPMARGRGSKTTAA